MALDATSKVQEWQLEQLDAHEAPATTAGVFAGEVAHLCQALVALFGEVLHVLLDQDSIDEKTKISLERSCGALFLWCSGHGIIHGHFNEVFSKCRKLRRATVETLSHIGEVLTESTCHEPTRTASLRADRRCRAHPPGRDMVR
jgi:hypothetical protein